MERTGEGCRSGGTPCLIKRFRTQGKETCTLYNILKPNNQQTRGEFIPELSGTTFYQKPCHQGWLIILCEENHDYSPSSWEYGDCFLWNPVTNETIKLPTLKEFCKGDRGDIYDFVLSSPPYKSTNRSITKTNPYNDNNDSIVLCIYVDYDQAHDHDRHFLLFCRPGETQWRMHKLSPDIVDLISERDPENVVCFKGKLYLMCSDWENLDNNLDHHLEIEHFTKDNELTLSVKSFQVKKEVLFQFVEERTYDLVVHYVGTHDELFRVIIIRARPRSREVISVDVVRLNFSLMEWEKVNSFGDHVLFVGYNNTTGCCSAAELGFKGGCLYFVLFGNPILYKYEIDSTAITVTLPRLWPKELFTFPEWVILPVQGSVENMLSKDEENGFLTALEIKTSKNVIDTGNQWEICNVGEVEAASYWNNLNEDTVLVISNYIHGSDYKHFRTMCKENRGIMPKVQAASYLCPWLVFSENQNGTIYNVVNPMYNNENYSINLSDLAGSTICSQKGGWLLITKNEKIFFCNPFTRETVKLPDIDRGYSVASFSSLPTYLDCVVFAMDHRTDMIHIDFIKRGEAHWSSCAFDNTNTNRDRYTPFFNTRVFHQGAFYCVDYHKTVGVFSAKDNSWKVLGEPDEKFDDGSQGYLLECDGDLLLVKVILSFDGKKSVTIFKLNFSEMEWIEINSLGEHMLFISPTSCVSAVAPNSYMKNNIYFPRLYLNDGGIIFYSLETGSYHSHKSNHSAKHLYDTEGWLKNCTWIEPNMLKSTSQELDWLQTPS